MHIENYGAAAVLELESPMKKGVRRHRYHVTCEFSQMRVHARDVSVGRRSTLWGWAILYSDACPKRLLTRIGYDSRVKMIDLSHDSEIHPFAWLINTPE